VQEAFMTAFIKLDDYKMGSDFPAWLRTFARNLALNQRRRWLREHRHHQGDAAHVEAAMAPHIEQYSESMAFHGDTLVQVRACVEALTGQAKTVITRHYYDGISGADIARDLGRNEGWARLVLFRARQLLARCLAAKNEVSHG
jgi:RNA polymerase sigma factor (sigma-70 family)